MMRWREFYRYHHKHRDYHFGSKAHREPPDLDREQLNIHTPSAVLSHGRTSNLALRASSQRNSTRRIAQAERKLDQSQKSKFAGCNPSYRWYVLIPRTAE